MNQFTYFLPVNIVFGCGRVAEVGALTAPYGKKALIVTAARAPRNPACMTGSRTA